jgi:hypothetical protein
MAVAIDAEGHGVASMSPTMRPLGSCLMWPLGNSRHSNTVTQISDIRSTERGALSLNPPTF